MIERDKVADVLDFKRSSRGTELIDQVHELTLVAGIGAILYPSRLDFMLGFFLDRSGGLGSGDFESHVV